jgi:hypothetical protein
MITVRRRLAIALALLALLIQTWVSLSKRDAVKDVERKVEQREQMSLLPAADPMMLARVEAKVEKMAEAGTLDTYSHFLPKRSYGSPLWKKNQGFSKLNDVGCHGRDCTIWACDRKSGVMGVGGLAYDRQTKKGVAVGDADSDLAYCIPEHTKRNHEWHRTFTFNTRTEEVFMGERKSWHD